jgi:hypothetical protein
MLTDGAKRPEALAPLHSPYMPETCERGEETEVDANKPSGGCLTSPDVDPLVARAERRRNGLALVTYWVDAGVVSTAAGAWTSTAFSGRLRILVWVGVTALLTTVAIWAAESATAFLSRLFLMAGARRSDGG